MSKSYEKKALVRIIILLRESPDDDIDIFMNDHFELSLTKDYEFPGCSPLSEYINENYFNEMSYFREFLKENGHTDVGIYEICAEYCDEWESSYDHWSGATEWDCNWHFENAKINKLNKKETKKFLEGQYKYEDKEGTMHLIYELGLQDELNSVRLVSDIKYDSLFLYNDKEDSNNVRRSLKLK